MVCRRDFSSTLVSSPSKIGYLPRREGRQFIRCVGMIVECEPEMRGALSRAVFHAYVRSRKGVDTAMILLGSFSRGELQLWLGLQQSISTSGRSIIEIALTRSLLNHCAAARVERDAVYTDVEYVRFSCVSMAPWAGVWRQWFVVWC
jgi:hypothetical protein